MPEKKALWKRALEYVAYGHSVHTILQTEFVRTWLLPSVLSAMTGTYGINDGVSLMWVLMASALVFMAVTLTTAGIMLLRIQSTPQNKMLFKAVFHCDLTPREAPLIGNRHQRRAQNKQVPQMLSSTQVDPNVSRTLDVAQIGVEVTNTAIFPISCFLESAETEIEGEKPPRTHFPKDAVTVPAGTSMRFMDDRIDMEQIQCQRLSGKMDLLLKYGRPGKEIFELRPKGDLIIVMEHSGFVSQILVNL